MLSRRKFFAKSATFVGAGIGAIVLSDLKFDNSEPIKIGELKDETKEAIIVAGQCGFGSGCSGGGGTCGFGSGCSGGGGGGGRCGFGYGCGGS